VVELGRWLRLHQPGSSGHHRKLLGLRRWVRQLRYHPALIGEWQRLQDGEQQDRHQAPHPEQRCLGEQGQRFLCQPLLGWEYLVQQYIVPKWTQYNMLASTWSEPNGKGTRTDGVKLTGDKAHILRNNVGYPNKNEYMDAATYGVDSQFNAWDLNITPKASDFLSITDPSVSGTGQAIETTSPALGPARPTAAFRTWIF